MFIHDTHLPQILDAEAFTSPQQHERELTHLFTDQWHFVGTTAELPRDGDFLTVERFGRPLIVWRIDGEFHAFLNVCPHRFSAISNKPFGRATGQLRCQYHGWEFDKAGCTRKIPDSQNFRPLTKGGLGLCKYHTAVCGQLIFVNFAQRPVALEQSLDWGYEFGEQFFRTNGGRSSPSSGSTTPTGRSSRKTRSKGTTPSRSTRARSVSFLRRKRVGTAWASGGRFTPKTSKGATTGWPAWAK
jgi:nitrite reductase/ring-hydroxylating ferredoxin subunit